jgi:hypothetical protein
MKQPPRKLWTPQEDQTLRALRAAGRPYDDIATTLARTPVSVRARWDHLNRTPEAATARRTRMRRRARNPNAMQINRSEGEARPPQAVIAERQRMFEAGWRSLTARLLGDPPIGRSALDRLQATRPRLWPWQ